MTVEKRRNKKEELVFSKHLVAQQVQERLRKFNELLIEMMGNVQNKPEALNDIRVVEVTQANFAGIIASTILAEMGAEVIKVEPPLGDPARQITPYGININGVGLPFLMESRNKYYITLDLETGKGVENFRRLCSKANIVIDAVKPGLLDFLQVGYRQLSQLNPGIVYVAISPFGHFTDTAYKHRNIPDSDLTAQAESGYPSIIGDPSAPEPFNYPIKAGIWAAWYMSAMLAVAGCLTALLHWRRTGEGQMVDVATNDAISSWQGFQIVWGATTEMPRVRLGNLDWCLFPYGYYQAKDGYITVATSEDSDFRGLLKILRRWDLENDWRFLFDRITDDVVKLRELENELKKEFQKYEARKLTEKALTYSARAARSKTRGYGFPIIVETLSPEQVLREKHWEVRGSFTEVTHPTYGKFVVPSPVPKMSETPPRIKWISAEIGEHNELIYEKYGLER